MPRNNNRRNSNQSNSDGEKRRPEADLYALVPQFDKNGEPLDPAWVPLCALWATKGDNNNLTGNVLSLPINVMSGEPMRVIVQERTNNNGNR